ncbi:hypothetical protein [Pseudoalteromonas sp. S16_S37]|uniref:hypothetical protein n=1 Tax=Pseudoalteromonas sp. S16_S37 TaxID=2720228 RepID=UPI00168190EE|nr:hypothetical protein [Pseudoalteromonas sp. S16_S37]MBD1583484.1 hypothetical protein [Pseudoalteromonas sp. S16_S37]
MIKPTVLLILLFTASGSLFLSRFPPTIVEYKNSSGYHTFIMAAFAGMILFGLTYGAVTLLVYAEFAISIGSWFAKFMGKLLPTVSSSHETLNLISVSLLTLILAAILPSIYKFAFFIVTRGNDPYLYQWRKDADRGDTHECLSLIFNSLDLELPIAFTLSNRKVYIGYVIKFGVFSNEIYVLPLISGYRGKSDLDVVKVINYKNVIHNLVQDELKEVDKKTRAELIAKKFSIAIPVRELVHANIHDVKHYSDFEKHRYDLDTVKPDHVDFDVNLNSSSTESKPRCKVRAGT